MLPGDDAERFLHGLRQLRDLAGLGLAELAARAHYPYEVLQAAEAGPGLPDLPVLSAYVRGCGGTLAEWEERWRSLTRSPASPLLPTRPAGCSDAATAGARIGTTTAPPDGHDPARIMAALDRVAGGLAAPAQPERAVPGMRLPAPAGATPGDATPGDATPGDATPGDASATPADATPAAARPADATPAAARPAAASPGSAARAPVSAGRARGAVTQRAVIAALVALALFLVGVVLVFAR